MRLPVKNDTTVYGAGTPREIAERHANGQITKIEAKTLFQKYLNKTFPPLELKKLIRELTQAEDQKYSLGVGFYSTPNWTARREGLRDVLKLMKMMEISEDRDSNKGPTKVQINIVHTGNPPAVKVEGNNGKVIVADKVRKV